MTDNDNYEVLLYLNSERIAIKKSRELFIGNKVSKYLRLLKGFHLIKIIKELIHDIYAFFRKDVSNNRIIDFSKDPVELFPEKVVVYTCIYGPYDKILEPLCIDKNCEYYIFTDQKLPENSIWKKADDSEIPDHCDTFAKKNRYVKMFPYKFFKCKYSIYIDGNLQIVGHPSQLVQNRLEECKTGIAMHIAPRENCIYEEAATVHYVGKITRKEKNEVIKMYKDNNMPHHFGMCECNVIVRNHENSNMKEIMEKWWEHYLNGVKRDQLYFTYTLFKLGYRFEDLVTFGASVNDNVHFLRKEHKY